MIKGKIKDILKVLNAKPYNINPEEIFSGISINSKKIKKGNIFIGIKGEKFDGNRFSKKAIKNGAVCVISEKYHRNIPLLLVKDTTKALQFLAKWWREKLDLKVIAVTGSNGKTTTKDILYEIIKTKFKVIKSPYSFNNHIGVPLTIFKTDKKTQILIQEMEMNELGGIKKLCSISKPNFGIITNIGRTHLKFLKNENNVFSEKKELADYLSKFNGLLSISSDDMYLKKLKKRKNVITFGIKKQADFKAEKITPLFPGWRFKVKNNFFEIKFPGFFNIYNTLAALSIATFIGISKKEIKQTLKKFKPPKLRMQIKKKNGITFILDCYNANPESMREAINSFYSEFKGKRKILILGDMLELGRDEIRLHREIGKYLRNFNFDEVITLGNLSIFYGGRHFKNKNDLKNSLKKYLKKGDTVFLKASRKLKLEEII